MKRFLIILFSLIGIHFSAYSQAGDLPAGYLGSVLSYTNPGITQNYTYSFTASTTGYDYIGFAFRQDPGFWTFTNPYVYVGNTSTNILQNGNLQYGGSVNGYGIQAPADWGVWYQNGTYPAAAGFWSPGQWYDGAVGSYDGIYQGIRVTAGTTYRIGFSLSGTNASSNPSIEVGTYTGLCASGTGLFSCTPVTASGFTALATPQATQGTGGAPAPTPPPAPAGPVFTDLKFSGNQIADTQWNVGSCTNAGGTNCQIYSKSPGPTWNTGSPVYPTSTQYIAFTATGDTTNPWHMWLYNSDGSVARDLGVGHILSQGLGSDGHHYFFFSNANYNGTLFSTDWGMNNTAGVTINGTNSPTVAQTNDFASTGSTTPLSSGATAGGGSSAPTVTSTTTTNTITTSTNSVTTNTSNQYTADSYNYGFVGTVIDTTTTTNTTPVTTTNYSDGSHTVSNGTTVTTSNTVETYSITPAQVLTPADRNPYRGTLVNSITINQTMGSANNAIQATQKGTGNDIEMSVTGVNNRVSANQGFTVNSIGMPSESTTVSNNNFAALSVSGNNNVVTSQQTGLMNSVILGVTGNYNTATSTQNGNNNQSYISINGNNNTSTVSQNGNNNLSALTSVGTGNSITVGQTGNNNGALISATNAGGPTTVNLLQQAVTQGQTFVVQQTCTNGAGCSVSVQQNR